MLNAKKVPRPAQAITFFFSFYFIKLILSITHDQSSTSAPYENIVLIWVTHTLTTGKPTQVQRY